MAEQLLAVPEIMAILETVGVNKADRARVAKQIDFVISKRPRLIDDEGHFEVLSGVSSEKDRAHVGIRASGVEHQMSPRKAQEVAMMLLTAAEAAISDLLLTRFLAQKIGITDAERLGMILIDFRELRQGTRDTVYPQ